MGPQPSPRHFNLSIPPSSARRSRHFSSAATRKASGSPVTPRGRLAEFSCLRARHCRLQERTAGRRMRNHISVREVRTRPGKQRQSAYRAAWIANPSCDASSAANGRLHRQNDESGQTPIGKFSRPLNRGPRPAACALRAGSLFIGKARHSRSASCRSTSGDDQAILYLRPHDRVGRGCPRRYHRPKGHDLSFALL